MVNRDPGRVEDEVGSRQETTGGQQPTRRRVSSHWPCDPTPHTVLCSTPSPSPSVNQSAGRCDYELLRFNAEDSAT